VAFIFGGLISSIQPLKRPDAFKCVSENFSCMVASFVSFSKFSRAMGGQLPSSLILKWGNLPSYEVSASSVEIFAFLIFLRKIPMVVMAL